VKDYLWRLTKYAALTPTILLSVVYYNDRLTSLHPRYLLNSFTAHRFLIAAATVASKGLTDSFYDNGAYAWIGGITSAELHILELELLYRLDWRIVPHPEVLAAYYCGLIDRSRRFILESAQEGGSEDEWVELTSPMNRLQESLIL
jgi:hypothetical protein